VRAQKIDEVASFEVREREAELLEHATQDHFFVARPLLIDQKALVVTLDGGVRGALVVFEGQSR